MVLFTTQAPYRDRAHFMKPDGQYNQFDAQRGDYALAVDIEETPKNIVPLISVCICTRNRPEDLAKAIRSVLASSIPAHEIIVSDDSTDSRSTDLVATEFPNVVFVEGLRKGLGSNRNCALSAVTGTHVAFIDDDVVMDPEFIRLMSVRLAQEDVRTIVTGIEMTNGVRTDPHRISFLGYQTIDYVADEPRETIVINATAFPSGLFAHVKFDPSLVYGCDEVDLAMRAVHRHGYRIVFDPSIRNAHFPSVVNRDFYASFKEASRLYVMTKRYFLVERSWLTGAAFVGVAYVHTLLYCVRKSGLGGVAQFYRTAAKAIEYTRLCLRDPASRV